MPRTKVQYMQKLQSIISTPPGERIEPNYGTIYNVGQSWPKVEMFLDLAYILERNVNRVLSNHGRKRAERFVQWANGRRINSYWRTHRPQLYEDIDSLKEDLDAWNYPIR